MLRENMKNNQKLLKMIFINNYCTDFMFQEVMVCVTCSPQCCLSLFSILFYFSRYHRSLLKFISTGFNYEIDS